MTHKGLALTGRAAANKDDIAALSAAGVNHRE